MPQGCACTARGHEAVWPPQPASKREGSCAAAAAAKPPSRQAAKPPLAPCCPTSVRLADVDVGAGVGALERVVVEQLLDEVDVRHEHAAAAVAREAERVERLALAVVGLQQVEVRVPLVADDLRPWCLMVVVVMVVVVLSRVCCFCMAGCRRARRLPPPLRARRRRRLRRTTSQRAPPLPSKACIDPRLAATERETSPRCTRAHLAAGEAPHRDDHFCCSPALEAVALLLLRRSERVTRLLKSL